MCFQRTSCGRLRFATDAVLAEDPFPQGVRSIEGIDNGYRIRVGMYRIVYSVNQAQVTVLVIRVRHRKDVYRGL